MNDIRAIRDYLLSELLPGVIHEINNPLGAIIMNVSITKEDLAAWKSQGTLPDLETLVETCHDMDIASERMNQHLQALSYFSGVRFLEETSSFDVNLALKHALTLFHNKLKRQVKVSVQAEEEGYLYLKCGPARGILAILLAFETVLAGGGEKELSITVSTVAGRIVMEFFRENMKIESPDQRLVALARVDDIELAVRDSVLSLALVAYDPDSSLSES
ncbi:hypothetical protein KKD52_02190 [Myxococcota bacterium]|nr:hypothetical protein [Myxococcota bacterium]MBU1509144.1 hypothetical protein [Myxococcota bacterium]